VNDSDIAWAKVNWIVGDLAVCSSSDGDYYHGCENPGNRVVRLKGDWQGAPEEYWAAYCEDHGPESAPIEVWMIERGKSKEQEGE
jgi:hypothetical protein